MGRSDRTHGGPMALFAWCAGGSALWWTDDSHRYGAQEAQLYGGPMALFAMVRRRLSSLVDRRLSVEILDGGGFLTDFIHDRA